MSSIEMAYSYPREVERAKQERWPVLIPVGTMEYHSAHCPYGCDALTAIGTVREIAKRMDCLVMPPVWYGVASYAVGGPEKNTLHVDCDTLETYMYAILKSLFKAGFTRNIHIITMHQTEEYLPQALACMKAAKKLTFEYLEETQGIGWWGTNANAEFYQNLSAEDNPWNWIRIHNGSRHLNHEGDHAGKYECAYLEALYPGSILLDRLAETDDWFAQSAREMDISLGKRYVDEYVENFIQNYGGK